MASRTPFSRPRGSERPPGRLHGGYTGCASIHPQNRSSASTTRLVARDACTAVGIVDKEGKAVFRIHDPRH
jgi:hypothetical protein